VKSRPPLNDTAVKAATAPAMLSDPGETDAFDDALRKSDRRRRRRRIPFTRSAEKVLELALREALAYKDTEIR
jgi:hypothetical protein